MGMILKGVYMKIHLFAVTLLLSVSSQIPGVCLILLSRLDAVLER
jgi:hypothetical protein